MANATTSSSKRKNSKIGRVGGLGGPGGRGSRRKSLRPEKGGVRGEELSGDMLRLSARDLAAAVKRRAGRGTGAATPYRTAMATITTYANRYSRSMLPETRVKLARAKDHLREMFDMPHEGKGSGAPGRRYNRKPKAQSRRNPRPAAGHAPPRSSRGGSHRAGGR